MTAKKIAFFVNFSHPAGTYFRWHNLAIALKQLGHEVDIYAGDHNWRLPAIRNECIDEIHYNIIPSMPTSRIFYSPNDPFSSFRRLLNIPRKKYDIYHLFQPFLQAYIPWIYLKFTNKNAIYLYDWDDLWTGGIFIKADSWRFKIMHLVTAHLEKKIPEVANITTVCSKYLKDRNCHRSAVLHNGFWHTTSKSKVELKKQYLLESDTFYLAYIGRSNSEFYWIIEALEFLSKTTNFNVKLLICGIEDEELSEKFKNKNISFISYGQVEHVKALEIASIADLGLIPLDNTAFNLSRFPIKFFDFLSVGTPVYMSEIGEVGYIGKSTSGVYLSLPEKDIWVRNLGLAIEFFKNSNCIVDIESLEEQYIWTAIASQLISIYDSVNKV